MTTPILIIDCHAICHAAKHAMKDLSYKEKAVGVIFGFMGQLLRFSEEFDTHRFVFAWDSAKRFRQDVNPDYKNKPQLEKETDIQRSKREEATELHKIAKPQFSELRRKVIPQFGFKNSFIQTGLEADDIIAKITRTYEDDEFIIISADSDLYQLLSENVSMYSPKSKKMTTFYMFHDDYGITLSEWIKVKQIAGCTSDNVKGIERVGEKTAIKYLKGELNKNTKTYQKIVSEEGQVLINANAELVTLPFKGTKDVKLNWDEKFYMGKFIDITDKYGFRSMQQVAMMDRWIQCFDMV